VTRKRASKKQRAAAAWAARGRAHLQNGALDAALVDASRALDLDPTPSGALFTRALVHSPGISCARITPFRRRSMRGARGQGAGAR
jgi:Tfp pilus assembly protein PilF